MTTVTRIHFEGTVSELRTRAKAARVAFGPEALIHVTGCGLFRCEDGEIAFCNRMWGAKVITGMRGPKVTLDLGDEGKHRATPTNDLEGNPVTWFIHIEN